MTLTANAHNKEIQRWIVFFVLYNNHHNKIYNIQHKVIDHQTYKIFQKDTESEPMREKFHNHDRIRAIHMNQNIQLKILINNNGW